MDSTTTRHGGRNVGRCHASVPDLSITPVMQEKNRAKPHTRPDDTRRNVMVATSGSNFQRLTARNTMVVKHGPRACFMTGNAMIDGI